MKIFLSSGFFVFFILTCGCSKTLNFEERGAHYETVWNGDRVCLINCLSDKLPEKMVIIKIVWGNEYKEVFINDESKKFWSKDTFISGKQINVGSGKGDLCFHEESSWQGDDYLKVQEWKFMTEDILIYKEVKLIGENGIVKRQQFFGPFGVRLMPPAHKMKESHGNGQSSNPPTQHLPITTQGR